jgi:hypothetical protein
MNIIILSFLATVCIIILYLVLERNFSEATTIAQQAGLNEQVTFPLTQDSKQFTYSMWIQVDRNNFVEASRSIIKRDSEISIEMKKNLSTLLISLPESTVISIARFPLQKVVFLTVCVTDKVGADKTKPYSIVDVYVDGKLVKSAQTNDVITPIADKGLIAGSGVPADQGIDVTTDVNGPLPPWATIYGLQRWSYYMLPKKVAEEFNRSKLMYKKNIDINLSLMKNEVATKNYKLF